MQIPEGVGDPTTWFTSFTKGPTNVSRILAYTNSALSGVIVLLVGSGFALRIYHRQLRWLERDGALTRPDFQLIVPAIWGVYSAVFAGLHAYSSTLPGGKLTWQVFIIAWYITQTSLALASIAACLSWLAREPAIRRYAQRYATDRLQARKKIYPTRFFAGLYMGGIAIFLASILPMMILHVDGIAQVFTMLDVIIVKYEEFLETGNLRLGLDLATLAKAAQERAMYVGVKVTKWAAGIFCFWSFSWAICIAVSAYSLRRSVQVHIASFPVGPDTRPVSLAKPSAAEVTPPLPSVVARSTNDVDPALLPPDSPLKSGWYSEDRPFGNTTPRTPVSLHPKHFQSVLDARTISATEKSKQLQAMLAKDAILSFCLLVVVLSLAASALYLAKATFNFTPTNDPSKLLLIHYAWGSYAFLVPALLVSARFLYDSIKLSQRSAREAPKEVSSRNALQAPIVFSIPLVATTAGVSVQRTMEITEEYMKDDELEEDKESVPRKMRYD